MTLRTKMITASTLVSTLILLALAFATLRYFERKQYETAIQQERFSDEYKKRRKDGWS
jgi:hypothetical protein